MKTKRVLAVLLGVSLAATALGACTQKKPTTGNSNDLQEVTTSDTYPIQTDAEFRWWSTLPSQVTAYAASMNDTIHKTYLEEATGVKIKFEHPVAGQEAAAFNILQSTDNMPDLIEYGWAGYPGGPQKAIDDNFIISLNSYIEKVCPNLRKIYEENPEYAKQMVTDQGNYFEFPFIRSDEKLATYMTYIIRKDLLDKAGLPVPETFDEWETALRAFKAMGIKAPISLRLDNNQLGNFSPFTSKFGFVGNFYHDENNKVKFGPYEESFGEWVKMLKGWYDEGLLDKEFANTDLKRIGAMVAAGENGGIFCTIGGEFGNWLPAIPTDSGIQYVATKIPAAKRGETPMFGQKDFPIKDSVAISTSCKNKEVAARFLDFGYSEAGHILYNFGKEGESFTYEDGPRGSHIPTYTPIVVDENQNGGLTVAQGMSKYIRGYLNGPFVQDLEYIYQYYQRPEQKDALEMFETDTLKYKLPILSLTSEEQQRYTDIMTPINTYRQETLAKMISGKMPISELGNYYKQLKDLGIEEAIQIQQAAYDRYLQRSPLKYN